MRVVLLLSLLVPLVAHGLEINSASRAQLEQLDGIGVTLAERMLAERARAPFSGWDDLRRRVKGLSTRRIEQWQAQGVTVNGERAAAGAGRKSRTKEER